MSTSADQDILRDNEGTQHDTSQQSTLGQLASAIRRSVLSFAIATIFLFVAFILIISRQNTLTDIGDEVILADRFFAETLSMQEAEKDYRLTGLETYLVAYNEHYNEAQEIIASLLENESLSTENIETLNRLNANAQTFKKIFDQAVKIQEQRGFDSNDEGTILALLREEALNLAATSQSMEFSPEFNTALLNLRLRVQEFIIFQAQQHHSEQDIVPLVYEAGENLRQTIANSEIYSLEQQELLSEITNNYLALFNRYVELTQLATQYFSDTTVAAHSAQFMIPSFTESLLKRQDEVAQQLFYILIATVFVLVAIFLLVIYQLRRAQQSADETLTETVEAQERAEAENERLNDSVISILEAVNALSQRDLRARAPVTEDIIGTVSDSINALADETARVLSGVTGIADHVSQVSDNVKLQALQVSETADEERANVNRMVESLLETTQVMNQVSALAEQTNASATQATTATDDALQTVTETVEGMDTIRQTISETEKRIKRLGERSQEISGIVNLINTISERTHVLALNASMQAAVAGEAGRGFAVVAQEVQQLAESSRHATDQIATLVNNIQIETNETINTVNRTISQVVEGTKQAQRAGTQMQRTQEITAELVASVASIAEASQQQKTLSAQLLESVQKIGESTERTAQQIAAQNSGTDDLQKAAAELVQSVNVFKLPAPQH